MRSHGCCATRIVRAYENGEFTDLTITCGSFTTHVHKLVVCASCDFFRKSVEFAAGREAEERSINLPEDDPDMIQRLITYLYINDYNPSGDFPVTPLKMDQQHESSILPSATYHSRYRDDDVPGIPGHYQCACLEYNTKKITQSMVVVDKKAQPKDYAAVEKPRTTVEITNPLTIHATMYALADKYQVSGLGHIAKDKFKSCLFHHVHSEDFVSAVRIVYTSTPDSNRGLRDLVIKAFLDHFHVDVLKIPGFEANLGTIDELSIQLIKSWPVKTETPLAFGGFRRLANAPPTPSAIEIFGGIFGGTA
ncbi:hypothetical protein IQ07DRAFT_585952 [Pyrenochaeta sp. DS3sAY3a]|nr:hypothetical protein IQ07DRAFT_585952 [Pyrenochaeta sp. DS3sAY3a]